MISLPEALSKSINVNNASMHYWELGQGHPILFLHGMPAHGAMWLKVMPYLANLGRCIAPDAIGLGQSSRPAIQYTLQNHAKYLSDFIHTMKLQKVTIVMHGWGSILGLHFAMMYPELCRGLCFYEPFFDVTLKDLSLPYFEGLQQERALLESGKLSGLEMVKKDLLQCTFHRFSDTELQTFLKPYEDPTALPVYAQYLRDLPAPGQPTIANAIIHEYTQKLMQSSLPKLLMYSMPGWVATVNTLEWAKAHLPQLELLDLGEEYHFAPLEHPQMMGQSISAWLQAIPT